MRMHPGQVDVDATLVAHLVARQFPRWASLPLRPVPNPGTVNAVYRLGDRLVVRLPLVANSAGDLERELHWLPLIAASVAMRIPEPVEVGQATERYPFPWAVYHWIEGLRYGDDIVDEGAAVRDLSRFITELRRVAATGAPRAGRAPLRDLDDSTRESIVAVTSDIDAPAALGIWERVLAAPAFDGVPVWIHSDLLPPNIVARERRIGAVIDWGGAGVGDPAADVIAAWAVFGPEGRRRFRDTLDVDEATWERARGFALHQALALIPYYRRSNPGMTAVGLRTVGQILADG